MPGTILKQLSTTPQTNGTAVTTTNSGWSLVQPGTGNTHIHSNAAKMGEPAGYELTQGSANQNLAYLDLASPVTQFAFRMPFRYAATPGVSVQIGRWYTAADHITTLGTMNIQSTGRASFVEVGATGTPLSVTSPSTTGSLAAALTDYVIMGLFDVTANTCDIDWYVKGATTPLFSLSGTLGADMAGAAGIQAMRFAIANSGTAVNSGIGSIMTNSAFAIGNGSGGHLPRHDLATALAHTVSVSPTSGPVGTVVNATITVTSGTAASYTVNWGDGLVTGPQASPSFSHTYTSAGTFNGVSYANPA